MAPPFTSLVHFLQCVQSSCTECLSTSMAAGQWESRQFQSIKPKILNSSMRIKHNQLDGLFVYKPIPIAVLSATFFFLRLSGALGTLGLSYCYNRKLMKWGFFQLCSTMSFMINKELFLKFTCLSVLVTAITEILTKSVAYSKCSSEDSDISAKENDKNCNMELIFVVLGIVYSLSSAGMIYSMLTTPAPIRKKKI